MRLKHDFHMTGYLTHHVTGTWQDMW